MPTGWRCTCFSRRIPPWPKRTGRQQISRVSLKRRLSQAPSLRRTLSVLATMRRCIPTKKSESAIGHNSMYAFDSIPAANLKHTFRSGVIRCVQTFVRPGEQRRLVRANVSVDVAKEEGLKNGCVDVVHGAVCHNLVVTEAVDEGPDPPLLLRQIAPKILGRRSAIGERLFRLPAGKLEEHQIVVPVLLLRACR